MKKLRDILKNNFLAGILVLLPISLTIYALLLFLNFMDKFLAYLPPKYNPGTYLPFHLPGMGFVLVIIIVFLTGLFTRNYVGKKIIGWGEQIFEKIPFLRVLYTALKQLLEAIFLKKEAHFRRVVLIEYPRKGIYSLGFVTGTGSGEVQKKTAQKVINVFVPTTPNPTSGFYLLIPEEELIFLDMSVEDAFKLIISGGIVAPKED